MKYIPKSLVIGLIFGIISLFTLFTANTAVFASSVDTAIKVEIDNTSVLFTDQQPVVIDGRTLVPVRGVFEQLGYTVNWDGNTQTAILSNAVYTIYITQGKSEFTTNGQIFYLDVPAQIINGRTMLPLRAVLESVGYGIDWNGSTRTVIITTGGVITETHYAEFPTVLNFGAFIKTTSDKVVRTLENNITVFTYHITVDGNIVRNYANELIKLGFVQNVSQTKVGYTVYIKGDIHISIDVTVNGQVTIKIWQTTVTTTVVVNLPDYPDIPDIGGFANPRIVIDKTTDENNSKVYWYKRITEVTIQTYINELIKIGYVLDNANSRQGYLVYVKGYLTVIIDTVAQRSGGYTLIIIRTVYFVDYPEVPVFPALPERTTPIDNGNGTIYWYLDVKEITVQDYIKYLIGQGYTNDTTQTKNGYYVYVKGDTIVIIDTISQKGYVLITIKITANINYYFHFPTVPTPNVRYEKFDQTNDEFGYVYWYTVLEKSVIESYINILRGQGFTVIQNADYYVCVKGSITVTVDAVSVTVKDTGNISLYYKDFPTVPDFAVVVQEHYVIPDADIVYDYNIIRYNISSVNTGWNIGNASRITGYSGSADLFRTYVMALHNNGFIELSKAEFQKLTGENTFFPIISGGSTYSEWFIKDNIAVSVRWQIDAPYGVTSTYAVVSIYKV